MRKFLGQWFPYVDIYWKEFMKALSATFSMMLVSGLIAFAIGFFFGIVLTITKPDGIRPNRGIYRSLDLVINAFRSIPFIILLIFLIPFTRFITGTAVGVQGAIVPLVCGCIPFFTRQVESALSNISPGKVEAARSMGSSTAGIVFRVYLKEALPDLIRAATITAISLIGLTTMAGAVGAGGIGSFAINYGQNQHHQDIVNICVIILLLLVTFIQTLGSCLARKTTNRKLFHFSLRPDLFKKDVPLQQTAGEEI